MKLELSAKIQLTISINNQLIIGDQAMLCMEKALLMRLHTSWEFTMIIVRLMGVQDLQDHLPMIAMEKVSCLMVTILEFGQAVVNLILKRITVRKRITGAWKILVNHVKILANMHQTVLAGQHGLVLHTPLLWKQIARKVVVYVQLALHMYVQTYQNLQTLDAVPMMVLVHVAHNKTLATKEKATAMRITIARSI